ncbi:MAG: hypothetical protein LQ344_002526 [Seirophora lacunosa]|nr:MAG: hypothetical protein LQ344_002526 [Seirophora lacunosa]
MSGLPSGLRPQHKVGSENPSGHYSNHLSTGRPDSYVDNYAPNQLGYGRRITHRVNSDPTLYGSNNHGLYPAHGYHQSYDTAASGSGNESHNTDPWGNSTDPSSENSSIDRIQVPKSDPPETYGFNGFGGVPQFQGPILEESGANSPAYGQIGYGQAKKSVMGSMYSRNAFPPAPPAHGATEIADTVGKLVCYRTVIAKRTSRETQELDQAEVQQSMRFIQL